MVPGATKYYCHAELYYSDQRADFPFSAKLQNCNAQQRIGPGLGFPCHQPLIKVLLENAEERRQHDATQENAMEVSTQQQRLRLLVKGALDMEATDIHMEVRTDIARIRFRKHGELFLHAEWLPKLAREVASVAFNKETDHNITHFNPLVPQNASMPLMIDDREVRLRLASLPAHSGFDVVMRIFTTAEHEVPTLEQLGYLPEQVAMLKRACTCLTAQSYWPARPVPVKPQRWRLACV